MITLRIQSPYESEWTEVSFEGEEEEFAFAYLVGGLLRQDWTIWASRNGEDFYEVGEDEEPV